MSIGLSVELVKAAIIKEMEGKRFLQPTGLIARLAIVTSMDQLVIKQGLARLSKSGWLDGVAQDGTPFAKIIVLGNLPEKTIDPLQSLWLDALNNEMLSAEETEALAGSWKNLHGLDLDQLRAIVRGLKQLKQNQVVFRGLSSYLVSARHFLGSSKLLGMIPIKSLIAFGIAPSQFHSHPPYVVVGGSSDPQTVVLVENPVAFELAIATEASQSCAFIATFGFGLSKSDSEYGNQLADLVDTGFSNAITLIREGSACPPVRELAKHPNITFWGDLDPAGIQIYLRLKRRLPQLELSALYSPMIAMLANPECSHPYVMAFGKQGQSAIKTVCPSEEEIAGELLKKCSSRGVDQECVSPDDISALANHPFSKISSSII